MTKLTWALLAAASTGNEGFRLIAPDGRTLAGLVFTLSLTILQAGKMNRPPLFNSNLLAKPLKSSPLKGQTTTNYPGGDTVYSNRF